MSVDWVPNLIDVFLVDLRFDFYPDFVLKDVYELMLFDGEPMDFLE